MACQTIQTLSCPINRCCFSMLKKEKKKKKKLSAFPTWDSFFFLFGLSSKALHFSAIQLLNPFFFFLCPSASSVTSSCDEIARHGTWRGQGPPVLPSPVLLAGAELFHAVTKSEHYKWFLRCEPWQHPHKRRDCLNFKPPFLLGGGGCQTCWIETLNFHSWCFRKTFNGCFWPHTLFVVYVSQPIVQYIFWLIITSPVFLFFS